jgi:hypothetical protein
VRTDDFLLLNRSGPAGVKNPLVGKVRLMPGGYLGDDTGYRRILLNHDFPILNRWVYDEAEARRGIEATVRAGFHGSRILHLVSDDQDEHDPDPNKYWAGREVTKAIFRAAAVPALSYMKSLGLRVILTAGHEYRGPSDEYGWWEELTHILKVGNVWDCVLWPEALGNEVGVNRPWLANNTPAAMAYVKPIQDIIRRTWPGTLISNGSFDEEDDLPDVGSIKPSLCGSSEGADLTDIHPRRHMPESVRYPHTIWYATHYFGSCRKPTSEGEEPGENAPYYENKAWLPRNPGGDVYAGCDDPVYLHTRLAIDQFTGQPTSYLNGPGVRRFAPLDSTIYFDQIVRSLDVLPQDIPTWQDDHNPSFFNRGPEFVYVGLRDWNQIFHPPRPVAEWTFYDMDGEVEWSLGQSHADVPHRWRGGIVKGRYA